MLSQYKIYLSDQRSGISNKVTPVNIKKNWKVECLVYVLEKQICNG